MTRTIPAILLFVLLLPFTTQAWIYPEHREIMLWAIQKLDSANRAKLDHLWALARKGFENRFDEDAADVAQGINPRYIDYAAWPAIAGDHSISARDMVNNILYTDWILEVADITARLKIGLDESHNASERATQMRDADLRLLRADPGYVTRAGSNNVHFMLARPNSTITAPEYFDTCFRAGSEINLVGVYKWYHASALLKARRLSSADLSPSQQSGLALSALADEAFALHFLEDAFAAGHIAGIWGNAALRKGTHDYYDEYGLEMTTWQGERMVLAGDAYMRDTDAERAAKTVGMSLMQILDAATLKNPVTVYDDRLAYAIPDTFDVGQTTTMPLRVVDPALRSLSYGVLETTPMPGLHSGLGEIARFRSELGPFIGVAPAARVSIISRGFGLTQQTAGAVPGLEFAVHIGLGMDGVLNASGDGLVFLDLGMRLDGSSTSKIDHDPDLKSYGSILSAIPSRQAFYTRIRMPFYVIPGDLVILAPVLLLFSPQGLNTVVSTAGQGGLIPWQTGMITPLGRFQFILGREVGICLYGEFQTSDAFLIPDPTADPPDYKFISMRSTQIDIPILEYRPVRTFSRRQSASLVLQLYAGVDIPGKVSVIDQPDVAPPPVKTIWSGGIRLSFDWRYYYAKKRTSAKH
jgi:hypothetical protein